MLELLERPETKPALAPPKRWGNWWLAMAWGRLVCSLCAARFEVYPGDVIGPCTACGGRTHPSREVAEIVAAKSPIAAAGWWLYLGAYREDERP